MKKIILLFTLLVSMVMFSQNIIENDIEYEIDSATLTCKVITYTGSGTSLVIPSTVTDSSVPMGDTYNVIAIEDGAFQSFGLTSLTLPNGIESLGESTFFGNNLTSLTIPSSVTHIPENCFRNNDIATLTLPNSVTSIGASAFQNNPITTLDLGTGLTSIGTAAFRDNAITGALTIPNGVTSLPDNCFRSNNITSLTLPSGLTSIGTACFFDSNLTTLTIPNSVVTIGNNAFHDNNNLTTLTLGTSVETIGDSAFLNDAIGTLVIPNNVTTIGVNAFRSNRLFRVTFGAAVTSVGLEAFAINSIREITSLSTSPFSGPDSTAVLNTPNINLRIPFGSRAAYTAAGWTSFKSVIELPDFTVNNVEYAITSTNPNEVTAVNYAGIVASPGAFTLPSQVTHNGITYAVTSVAQNAFLNKGITNLTLNEGLREIGTNAFSRNSIDDLVIPNSVTVINDNAFVDNEIRTITLGSGLTSLGTGVFSGTNTPFLHTITNLSLGRPVLLPAEGAATDPDFGNRRFVSLNIPTGTTARYTAAGWTGFRSVTEIAIPGVFVVNDIVYQVKSGGTNEVTAAFYNGTTSPLVTLNIPSQVTNNGTTYDVTAIANNVFSNLGIVNLSLPNTLTSIGTAAFRDNLIRGALTIPNGVTSLPDNCFRSNNITSLTLPNGLISIGTACFFDSNLTTLTIPNSVVTIGNNAFHDNNNLTTLTLGTSVETIDASAFLNNKIGVLNIPNSVTTIGANAFKNNSLTEVTLGSGVNVIDAGAFSENASITSVNSLSTSPATLTTTGLGYAEGFVRGNIDLLIPTGTTADYTSAGWTGFKSVTEDTTTLSIDTIALNNNVKFTVINNILSINTNNNIKVLGVSVYQLTGKQVLNTTNSTANINSLASGVYIVSITTDKGVVAKKIVKN